MYKTYIKIRGKWVYLHRAVNKEGMTVDFRLSSKRDMHAAADFLCRAIGNNGVPKKQTSIKVTQIPQVFTFTINCQIPTSRLDNASILIILSKVTTMV